MRSAADVAIVSPLRTPIGKFGGALAGLTAVELGAAAARAVLERTRFPVDRLDQVIFGQARQAGGGPNPARQIGRGAGLPDRIPAWTVNQACGSGVRAIVSAHHAVALGEAGAVLAGGTESMSRVPYLLDRARFGHRMGHVEVPDGMYRDGFACPLCGLLMGETAEVLAERHGIGREEQDRYAAESQRRCEAARHEGRSRSTTAGRPASARWTSIPATRSPPRRWGSCRPCSAPAARSTPGTPPASPTAPRPAWCCRSRQRARSSPDLRPGSSALRPRGSTRR